MRILNDQDFADEIKSGLAFVDFFAEWCGPCKMIGPVLEQLAPEYEGKINFFKLDVDKAPTTAQNYGVMSVPTMILFKDGEIIEQMVGFKPADDLRNQLDQHIA